MAIDSVPKALRQQSAITRLKFEVFLDDEETQDLLDSLGPEANPPASPVSITVPTSGVVGLADSSAAPTPDTVLDLTDRITHDKLSAIPGLQASVERTVGSFDVRTSTLKVDNSTHFWDQAPPTGVSSWKGRKVRISLITAGGTLILGHWLIENLHTNTQDGIATLRLVGQSKRLVDKKADRVRESKSWYANRPIGWLVRELLMQEFTKDEVDTFDISSRYTIPLADSSDLAVSHYGRPPEWDGTVWREDGLDIYGSPMLYIPKSGHVLEGHVVIGLENELWDWNPTTDTWTKLATVTTTGHKIMHLFWNDTRGYYIGVTWEEDINDPDSTTTPDDTGAKNGDVKFFWGDGDTNKLVDFSGQPSEIWTGHFTVRAGGYNGTSNITGIGGVSTLNDNGRFGVNMLFPQGHWIRWRGFNPIGSPPYNASLHVESDWDSHSSTTPSDAAEASSKDYGTEESGYRNYNKFEDSGNGDVRPMRYRYSMGQSSGAFAIENAGDRLYFCTVSWDGTAKEYDYRLRYLDTNAGTFTDTSHDIRTLDDSLQPYTMHVEPDDSKLWVGGAVIKEDIWSGGSPQADQMFGAIYTINIPTGFTRSRIWEGKEGIIGSSDEKLGWIPLQITLGADDRWLAVAGIDYRRFDTKDVWFAAVLDTSQLVTGQVDKFRRSHGRISGLVYWPVKNRFYGFDSGVNGVVSMASGSNSAAPIVEDNGFPPVTDDPGLACGLVHDLSRQALYGVSARGEGAQTDPQILQTPLSARYLLWQLANNLTDRIELADFTEMNVWDALQQLALVGDFLHGFDINRDGLYSFQPRAAPTAPLSIMRAKVPFFHDTVPIEGSLNKDFGFDEIYNYVEMIPSAVILRPVEGEVELIDRPDALGHDQWEGDLQTVQKGSRTQNIFMRCVEGSEIGRPDDGMVAGLSGDTVTDFSPGGSERYHRLRFAFLLFDRMVESQLLTAITSVSTTIELPIQHAKDITASAEGDGDIVTIGDNVERSIIAKAESPAVGLTTLTLASAVGQDFAKGTHVVVRAFGNNRWSNHPLGLTEITAATGTASEGGETTITVANAAVLPVGAIIRTAGTGAPEDMRVTASVSDTQVTVKRGAGGSAISDHGIGTRLQVFWAPIENSTWPIGSVFMVGDTNIGLRVNLPAEEKPFMVGDEIDLVAPGLVLEDQELATIVSESQLSRLRHGRLPFPETRSSRFLGYRQTLEANKRIIRDFADPHFKIEARGKLTAVPAVNEAFELQDEEILPSPSASASPNGDFIPASLDSTKGIAVVVRGYRYDLSSDQLTLSLRAWNGHVW